MWLLCIFNVFSKSFSTHMSLLLELQLEIVCSNESFMRAPTLVLPPPLLATTAFNLFNKIFTLPAAAAAPSMLSNVPNKIDRERDSEECGKMSKKWQATAVEEGKGGQNHLQTKD